ncbi:MAG: flippase-like domain-containing protein [Actinobacteria bacterium]|nr:flippase-like domain-containing protein [Actinomycetota bacterium]
MTAEEKPAFSGRPGLKKNIIMGVLTLVIVVIVFAYLLPKFASYHDVFDTLKKLDFGQVVLLIAASLLNLALAWTVNQASLPGFKNRQAAQLLLSQNLIASTLPLGGAWSVGLGYPIIHSYGFGVSDYSLMLSISMVWNTLAKFALPAVALLFLLITGHQTWTMLTIALVGLGLLVASIALICLALWKRSMALRLGNAAGRSASWFLKFLKKGPVTHWGESLSRFRDDIVKVTSRRWLVLTLLSTLYQLSMFLVFLLSLRFAGVADSGRYAVSWVVILGVFAFARLVTAVPITSGAIGIAEASFTGMLIAAGAPRPETVAGVLLFRALTWFMPIPIGLPVYFQWFWKQRKKKAGKPGAPDGMNDT